MDIKAQTCDREAHINGFIDHIYKYRINKFFFILF